jgi:hypothetical protein
VTIRSDFEHDEAAQLPSDFDTVVSIVVTPDDGKRIEGVVRYQLPEAGRRLP